MHFCNTPAELFYFNKTLEAIRFNFFQNQSSLPGLQYGMFPVIKKPIIDLHSKSQPFSI